VTSRANRTISDEHAGQDHRDRDRRGLDDALPCFTAWSKPKILSSALNGRTKAQPIAHDERGDRRRRHSRSLIISATRSALATIVSVGFTAPIEGKKLASVSRDYRLRGRGNPGSAPTSPDPCRNDMCPPGARCRRAGYPCRIERALEQHGRPADLRKHILQLALQPLERLRVGLNQIEMNLAALVNRRDCPDEAGLRPATRNPRMARDLAEWHVGQPFEPAAVSSPFTWSAWLIAHIWIRPRG